MVRKGSEDHPFSISIERLQRRAPVPGKKEEGKREGRQGRVLQTERFLKGKRRPGAKRRVSCYFFLLENSQLFERSSRDFGALVCEKQRKKTDNKREKK